MIETPEKRMTDGTDTRYELIDGRPVVMVRSPVPPRMTPVDIKLAHLIRESLHHTVPAGDFPAGGERRHLAREMLDKRGADRFHLRT